MTIRDSLAQVQELLDKKASGAYSQVDRYALEASAINFLRTHGPELMKMMDRHSAGDADRSAELTTAWMAGAERERDRAAEAWRPIESAPRDGSYILVCNSHGSWIAKYQHFYPSGYRPSSPWASMMLNHDHIEKPGRSDHPTHWRPLPAPPTDEAARAGERGG